MRYLLSLWLCCVPLSAATLVYNGGVTGTVYTAAGVDENSPASLLDGILVSATFSDGNTLSCALAGGQCAVTDRFQVGFSNAFNSPNVWHGEIRNLSQSYGLLSSSWNAVPGDAVWDVISQVEITPGSGPGLTVSGATLFGPNQSPTTAMATAVNAVQISGSGGPLYDLFTQLDFQTNSLPYQHTLAFSVDVDRLTASNVPDAPVMLQVVSGGLLLLTQRRRWRKETASGSHRRWGRRRTAPRSPAGVDRPPTAPGGGCSGS